MGRAIVHRLDAAGYSCGVTWNTNEGVLTAMQGQWHSKGRNLVTVHCDLRNSDAAERAFEEFAEQMGPIALLVVNAGILPEPVLLPSVQELDEAWAINVRPLLIAAHFLYKSISVHGGHGRLIAIDSVGADAIWKNRLSYNVTKSAQRRMMQSLARDLAPTVSVNSVAPGIILSAEASPGTMPPIATIPGGRYGTPEEVADAVMYFATCSEYVVGETIRIDGGYSLTQQRERS